MEGIRICAVSSFGRFKSSQGVVTNPKPAKDGYVRVQINRKSNHAHPVVSERGAHGYRGVSRWKGKWRAQVQVKGKR